MKAGNGDAFTSFIDMTSSGLGISPMITRTSIQKDGNEEQVNKATSHLNVITAFLFPLIKEVCDARDPPDFKMLPAPMRGDSVVLVWAKVPLAGV